MKKHRSMKFIAFCLVIVFCINCVPLYAFALENNDTTIKTSGEETIAASTPISQEEATQGPVEIGKDNSSPNRTTDTLPTTASSKDISEKTIEKVIETPTIPLSLFENDAEVEQEISILSTAENKNHFEYGQLISLQYCVKVPYAYDDVSLTCLSTADVCMKSDSAIRSDFPIGEYQTIDVQFTVADTREGTDEEKSNVRNLKYNSVIIDVTVWKDGEVKDSDLIEIWILSTPYGAFVTHVDPLINKRTYNRYLLQNNIIDQTAYNKLNVVFHQYNPDETVTYVYTVNAFDESVSSKRTDVITEKIYQEYNVQVDGLTAASNQSVATRIDTSLEYNAYVDFGIHAYDGGETLVISGTVYWSDSQGIVHPAPMVDVKVWDEEIFDDDLLASVETNSYGAFNVEISNETGLGETGGYDIYLQVYSGNEYTYVYEYLNENTFEILDPFYFFTPIYDDVDTTILNLHGEPEEGRITPKAFSISNAILYARWYECYLNDDALLTDNTILVCYPMTIFDTSFTVPNTIHLTEKDYNNWGTIIHEYGHIAEAHLGLFFNDLYELVQFFASNRQFNHSANKNLIDYYQGYTDKGIRIAWMEGWASYFSLCVQKHFNLEQYGYREASCRFIFNCSIEDTWYGEDNELAVAAVFWELSQSGIFTEQELWDLVKDEQPQSMDEFIDLITAEIVGTSSDIEEYMDDLNIVNALLEKHNFSANVFSLDLVYEYLAPRLRWNAPSLSPNNTNGYVYTPQYKICIVYKAISYTYESDWHNFSCFDIPDDVWMNLQSSSWNNGFYWYVVTKFDNNSSASGTYMSQIYHTVPNYQAWNISPSSRVYEKRISLDSGEEWDFGLSFGSGCNYIIQTFGTLETVIELFAPDGTLLKSFSDTYHQGYEQNAFLSYTFEGDPNLENGRYILRVSSFTGESGETKVSILPSYSHESYDGAYGTYGLTTVGWSLNYDRVAIFRYAFDQTGDVTFTMFSDTDTDTYLYIIDPRSTDLCSRYTGSNSGASCLYDDNSAGNRQAQLTKHVEAGQEYVALICFRNPHTMTGSFGITTTMP